MLKSKRISIVVLLNIIAMFLISNSGICVNTFLCTNGTFKDPTGLYKGDVNGQCVVYVRYETGIDSSGCNGEACTGDPEEDIWYFQVIRRNAKNIPLCNPDEDENCEALVCGENEADCEYEFCSEEAMEEQYASACNDPVEYLLNNPEEDEEGDEEEDLSADEAAECEEGDEECITQEKVECEEGDEECITQEENSNEDGACEAGDETCQDESALEDAENEEVKSDEIES